VGQFKNINTAPFNLTGHPALSLNVGKVQPDDVSFVLKLLVLSVSTVSL